MHLSGRILLLNKFLKMIQAQLTAMLEGITGHLTTADQNQQKQLQQARERIAASLVSH